MRRYLSVVTAAIAISLAAVQPAAATLCTDASTVADHLAAGDPAFVGEVVATRNEDRWATFRVTEVWSDDEVPEFIEIRGTLAEEGFLGIFSNVTSDDRYYRRGATYLVMPDTLDGAWYDGTCSATELFSNELAALRPSSAHPPVPGGSVPSNVAWPIIALGLATLAAVGFIVERRRARGGSTVQG